MNKVRIGVIGVGVLGYHHARLYNQHSSVELVGLYDIDFTRAEKVANEFKAKPFKTIDQLIGKIDAASVAVPTHLHFEVVSKLLDSGVSVLVEKPITANVNDAKKLLDQAKTNQLVLQVGHVERYNPVITYLESRIHNPKFIEAHRLSFFPPPRPGLAPRGTEVGVVLDLMIHDIDVIINLVKEDITQIDAVGVPILSPLEDIANARITFSSGCVANITASRVSQEAVRKIRLFQENAYLSLDYQSKKGEIVSREGSSINREPLDIDDHNALQMELEDFVNCVEAKLSTGKIPQPKVSAEHGLRALEIANEITQQIREKSISK